MKRTTMLTMSLSVSLTVSLGLLAGCDSGPKPEAKSAAQKAPSVTKAPDLIKPQFETLQQSKGVEATVDAAAEERKKQLEAAEK